MGRLFNRTKTGEWTYAQGIDELTNISKSAGIEVPDTAPKPSTLNRLFGLLSAGETAPLAMELVKGGSVTDALKKQGTASLGRATLQGVGEAPTYADVLEQAGFKKGFGTKAAGLGLDILLDPTTYLGVGLVGKAGKFATKGVKTTANIARKVPILEKGITALEDTGKVAKELFDPIARLQKGGSSRATAEQASSMINTAIKSGRYQEQTLRETVEGLVKKGTKETPDAGKLASQYLESGKTTDLSPELKDIADYVNTEFGKMWGEEYSSKLIKNKIADYVPHILTPEAKAFFQKSGQGFTTLPTSLGAAKGRKLEGSILEANAIFKETLEKAGAKPFDLFEPDLLKAFATRKKASIRALTMRGLVDDISNTFGKAPSEIGMVGKEFGVLDGVRYVPVPENAIRFFPTLTDAGNKVLAVAKNNRKFVPEGIAEGLKDINKVLINDDSMQNLLKMYDSTLSIWKKSVTGIFPAFHGRNAMGGMFNNFIAGVKNPARYVQAEKLARNSSEIVELGGKKYAYSELLDLMKQKGVIGQQGYIDVFSEVDKVAGIGSQGKVGKVADTLFNKAPEKTMNAIETRLRGSLLIDRLAKGDSIDDAVKQVFKYHFDYAPEAFTPFERNVMRRMIPFYTWTRRNIPLQIEQMYKQPGKFSAIGKTSRTLGGDQKETALLPKYMRGTTPISLGKKDGLSQFLYGAGLPIEDINKIGTKDLLGMLAPPIKVPLELATKRNFYFKQPLENLNTPPKAFKNVPKPIKALVDYNEKTGKVDPAKWHILSSLLGRGIYTADKLADPSTKATIKILYSLFGIKGKSVDLKKEANWRDKEAYEKLAELLKQKGELSEFSRYYVPKEKQ
ncbi:MAG: hypothetical protein NUV65_05735 [Candidatus Roizmanbacteria bacterium]|nr:hypothetical protein [Candidatus Roizmanbacteria bacterium]